MSTSAIENPLPVNGGESKSARKKKAKAEAAASSTTSATAIPQEPAKEDSSNGDVNGSYEHPHLKELQKQIRNVNKRLAGLAKTDAVQEANPGVSLDDLVAQRKINNDQRAAAEKKPGLQEQLQSLEEQVKTFRTVDSDYQSQMQKQKDALTAQHQKELEKAKDDHREETTTSSASELRKKLLVFSQFLRAAAAKRNELEEAGTDESAAFEGALLLVYGGDQHAVETAVNIIEGTDEQVPNIEGAPLPVKYSQIKQASIDHAPFQSEEAWVNDVAEANAEVGEIQATETETEAEPTVPSGSDPTIANAGMTELEDQKQDNGVPAEATRDTVTSPVQAGAGDEAGNLAGDRWDTGAGAQPAGMEDSFEMVPRPNEEVDTPVPAAATTQTAIEQEGEKSGLSWADEATAAEPVGTSGNTAGEAWDSKPAGQTQEDGGWGGAEPAAGAQTNGFTDGAAEGGESAPAAADDGFQQIPNRTRGRGGRGRGDGEFRGRGRGGRGGGFRGDGEFRGGRGGRGGFRGDRGRGDGEGRGRGGRGRGEGRGGPRGDAAPRS